MSRRGLYMRSLHCLWATATQHLLLITSNVSSVFRMYLLSYNRDAVMCGYNSFLPGGCTWLHNFTTEPDRRCYSWKYLIFAELFTNISFRLSSTTCIFLHNRTAIFRSHRVESCVVVEEFTQVIPGWSVSVYSLQAVASCSTVGTD